MYNVADVYFSFYPACVRPDSKAFASALRGEVLRQLYSMNVADRREASAAAIVYNVVAQLANCQQANVVQQPSSKCQELMELLGNYYITDAQKQAILLTLQNRGCLN